MKSEEEGCMYTVVPSTSVLYLRGEAAEREKREEAREAERENERTRERDLERGEERYT